MWVFLAMAVSSACHGGTTLEVEACFTIKLDADAAAMKQYRQAALDRIGRADHGQEAVKVTAAFVQAEQAWEAYREAECGAVYESWSQGTIRGLMAIQCKRRLTQQRTHAIWSSWLTYADTTPPALPEPPSGKDR